ncbi:MAG TPA: YggS family pyridoxal phosphate-dependent enzyme [Thermoanaerobaculia bacterium]
MSILERVHEVEERIAAACARSGRSRDEVTLVAISKTFPASLVDEAIEAGVTDVGENRVQELKQKVEQTTRRVRWHLVGHLQSNKAREAARLCTMIQSVDSLHLAERIGRAASEEGKRIEVLIQINVGDEPQKSGVEPAEASRLAEAIAKIDALDLRGLMTIPPIASTEQTRASFRRMREIRDNVARVVGDERARVLSMGMSDDFEIAIEEESTMVRIGRAMFGERERT